MSSVKVGVVNGTEQTVWRDTTSDGQPQNGSPDLRSMQAAAGGRDPSYKTCRDGWSTTRQSVASRRQSDCALQSLSWVEPRAPDGSEKYIKKDKRKRKKHLTIIEIESILQCARTLPNKRRVGKLTDRTGPHVSKTPRKDTK